MTSTFESRLKSLIQQRQEDRRKLDDEWQEVKKNIIKCLAVVETVTNYKGKMDKANGNCVKMSYEGHELIFKKDTRNMRILVDSPQGEEPYEADALNDEQIEMEIEKFLRPLV
jgi:hypothetical protein